MSANGVSLKKIFANAPVPGRSFSLCYEWMLKGLVREFGEQPDILPYGAYFVAYEAHGLQRLIMLEFYEKSATCHDIVVTGELQRGESIFLRGSDVETKQEPQKLAFFIFKGRRVIFLEAKTVNASRFADDVLVINIERSD